MSEHFQPATPASTNHEPEAQNESNHFEITSISQWSMKRLCEVKRPLSKHSRSACSRISRQHRTHTTALPASDIDASKAVKLSLKRATTASIVDIDYIEDAGGRWFTDVNIGGHDFWMMVDTGSGDLWVYGPEVENPGNIRIYTPTTRPVRAEKFEVRYGMEGKEIVAGIVVKDTVGMGSVSIGDVPVEVATDVSVYLPADGSLGMGHSNSKELRPVILEVGPRKLPSFTEVMMKSLEAPVFTLDLSDPVDAIMTLGSVDHSRYTGELKTVPAVTESAGWVLGNVSFAVNGVPMGFIQEEMAVGKILETLDPA
ncbi:MAG: hypothetical protein Q9177_004258 [Variospora cf. flavescens]